MDQQADSATLSSFNALARAAGLQARPYQSDLAGIVSESLNAGAPCALAIQAATGLGKTWALAFPALVEAAKRRRVVWSTHTLLLRAQVIETLRQAHAAAGGSAAGLPAIAERRGRADYVSASRTLRLRHALAEQREAAETIGLLDALSKWPGSIAEFVADFGDLPVPQSLICLTAACPAEEQAAFVAQRDAAAQAGIVVQTHALTLLEARYRRLAADVVIFDEADTLPSVAAGALEVCLPLDDIEAQAEEAGVDVSAPMAALRARVTDETIVWRDGPMAAAANAIATALRQAARDADADHGEALRDLADDIHQFAAEHGPRAGAALVDDKAAGPALTVTSVDAAGWLGGALKDRQVVLVSATLGRHDDELDEVKTACRRLGFFAVEPLTMSPPRFGDMSFRLASRAMPMPFIEGGEPNPSFFDGAAHIVKEAAGAGRTLVLAASYGDVEELARRLGGDALLHRRGERLRPLIEQFKASANAVLVTPAAWAGLDLPGLVQNVVILRLPLGRPDPLREAILASALRRRGMADADARNILASEARGDAMRRLTQGMGRGIRRPEDRCTIWIADPRFPLPASMIISGLRRGLTQGPAEGWKDFAKAIPLRFRLPAGRSAYDRARLIDPVLMPAE
ncbi:helicase C-terminal domain-containing protein [Falsiroseomonas sp. HW251]|uniref:helicase C-terminal domain-containing protein n=1 Tax=Falsiroseomonas sp. HW251 TaxID=3390998 RepID=UPI003D3179FA